MAGNPPWAPEEDQRLQALALSGASVAEMAKQMNRSEEAVRSRAYRLKGRSAAVGEADGLAQGR
jgi:DNA-directed RNA polymerase specialized sigma24 family protein